MDPRPYVIEKRMEEVRRVIAVAAGKGGVGKSSVASLLSLELSRRGYKVGLMDLDFYGPSDHVVLGVRKTMPIEDKGVIPPEVNGIKFMSIIYYSRNMPFTARGAGISNSIAELLAITRWGRLDFLILDMPPGFGDATLDVMRLIPKTEFLVVSTASKLSVETVKKLTSMLQENRVRVIGLIENMGSGSRRLKNQAKALGIPFLGSVKYDKNFEESLGSKEKLLKTSFLKDISRLILKI